MFIGKKASSLIQWLVLSLFFMVSLSSCDVTPILPPLSASVTYYFGEVNICGAHEGLDESVFNGFGNNSHGFSNHVKTETLPSAGDLGYPDNWNASNGTGSGNFQANFFIGDGVFEVDYLDLSSTPVETEVHYAGSEVFFELWEEIWATPNDYLDFTNNWNGQKPLSTTNTVWNDPTLIAFLQIMAAKSTRYPGDRSTSTMNHKNFCFFVVGHDDSVSPAPNILGAVIDGVNVAVINESLNIEFAASETVPIDRLVCPEWVESSRKKRWFISTSTRIHEWMHRVALDDHHDEGWPASSQCSVNDDNADCVIWSDAGAQFNTPGERRAGVLCGCCWERVRTQIN